MKSPINTILNPNWVTGLHRWGVDTQSCSIVPIYTSLFESTFELYLSINFCNLNDNPDLIAPS